jgi:hypothetical protein
MRVLIFLLLFTTSVWANTADIKTVTLSYGLANAEFQYLGNLQNRTASEDALFLELASALQPILPILQSQLITAEKNLKDINPKDFSNPKWWTAVQNLRYAQQQVDSFVPPKDSDIVFYFTAD